MSDRMIPFERMVNQTLWGAIMYAPYQGEDAFENEVFVIKPYSWDWDNIVDSNDWHFYHKPSGFKLRWYKYPLRGPEVNMNINHEQFYAILQDCMNSVSERIDNNIKDCTFDKWWEE